MSVKGLRKFTKRAFIAANIIIAVCFLLGCYGSWFNPKHFWFIGFFALGAFYFLVLLIGFILFWFFAKPKYVLISLISVLLAWVPLKHLVKFRLSSKFSKEKNAADIRIMSWNVEHFDILEHKSHPERKQMMFDIINEYNPDVACFQEMVGSDSFPSAINYIPSFLPKLNMSDYHYSYNWKVNFDDYHHFGIITFSKYPVINKQTVSFPPGDYNSIFQYIDIVKGNDTFRIFNIHLQSLKFSDQNLQYIDDPSLNDKKDIENSKSIISKFKTGFLKHRIQAERIRKEVDNSPYPAIICGDFNDVPNSYAYDVIGKGMRNAFAEKGTGVGRTFFSISPTLRIDNIFSDQRFTIDQYMRIKRKISDHFPIVADLGYKGIN